MKVTEEEETLSTKRVYQVAFGFCENVRGKLSTSDYQIAFLKHLYLYSIGKISKIELKEMVIGAIAQFPDLVNMFNDLLEHCEEMGGFLSHNESETSSRKIEEEQKENKPDKKRRYGVEKPVREIDLSKDQFVTPSYRLVPQDCPGDRASQRSEIDDQVLNDQLVCKPSEDGSFKHGHRNIYKQILFRCEDDQCKVDVLLNSLKLAEKRVEKFLENIKENKISLETPFKVEDQLSILNIRCIETLYQERGHGDHQVIDKLKKDPVIALPIILGRLTQKVNEFTELKSDSEKIWAEVYAENHYKSLTDYP